MLLHHVIKVRFEVQVTAFCCAQLVLIFGCNTFDRFQPTDQRQLTTKLAVKIMNRVTRPCTEVLCRTAAGRRNLLLMTSRNLLLMTYLVVSPIVIKAEFVKCTRSLLRSTQNLTFALKIQIYLFVKHPERFCGQDIFSTLAYVPIIKQGLSLSLSVYNGLL